jgi:predicted DNA-binding transcriptional regulator AlpA
VIEGFRGLRVKHVSAKLGGCERSKIYRMMAGVYTPEDPFPQPLKIGQIPIWSEAEVDAWIARRLAERDQRRENGELNDSQLFSRMGIEARRRNRAAREAAMSGEAA